MKTEKTPRQKFFFRLRWYSLISGTFLFFVLVIAGYVYAPFLKIDSIIVPGVSTETRQAIIKEITSSLLKVPRSAILGPDHYASWPTSFPYTTAVAIGVKIDKSIFSRSVTISLIPRERYAIWCSEESNDESSGCFWIDSNGVAFEKSPMGEGQLLRTIYAKEKIGMYTVGEPVLDSELFANVKKILDGISGLQLRAEMISYDESLEELTIKTDFGTKIVLSVRFDPTKTAIPALRRIMIKPGLSELNSINLTVENRAYLKYR